MLQRWSKHMTGVLHAHLRRGALLFLGVALAVVMVASPMMARPAHAQGISDLLSLGGSFTNGLSSCSIETVGWVICPTMRSIAKLADYGFAYINDNFLRIDYALVDDQSGTYTAWEIMRTVANAAFVVAFMVLVYSQISGRGSGGYSIKRLLPRLIVAAIAVNISYFLCVILIDISNIMGDSILFIMNDQVASRIGNSVMPIGGNAGGAFQDGTLATLTAAVLQKTGVAWVLLAPVAAVIVSVATICAAMLILLIMRKTIVALLVLVSPLLFVAYLLPNLERFFTAGVRLFIQMIMLYPIIALLLGAGQIASTTIVSVGSNDANYRAANDFYFSRTGGSGSAITDATAAAAAVVPLLGVWFLFKNMSSVMNMASSRLSAAVKGRRGDEDKEARVTGKATAGAQNRKQMFGEAPNRRQAFTRGRRRTLGGSTLTGSLDDRSRQPAPIAGPQPSSSLAEQGGAKPKDEAALEEEKRRQDQEAAALNGNLEEMNLEGLQAEGGSKDGDEKEKVIAGKDENEQVTAKDIFSQMNRKQGTDSKDKERKLSAGPPPAGTSGGGESGGGASQPSAPTSAYRAPQMAQSSNIVSGSSGPVQPVKAVAVPVQVDSSSLLGNKDRGPGTNGEFTPPISGTQEKAKARANKYIYDSEKELDDARNRDDILGKKHSNHDDEPHDLDVRGNKENDKDNE